MPSAGSVAARGIFRRSILRSKFVSAALLLVMCVSAVPSMAQSPVQVLLQETGKYLLDQLAGYIFGKVMDKTVAYLTHQRELSDVEHSLVASLNDSNSKSEASIAEMREELKATRVQLEAFSRLERQDLSGNDRRGMRDAINLSLQQVSAVLEDHERRLVTLDHEVKELQQMVALMRLGGSPSARLNNPSSPLLPPSFNCANARTRPERLICGDARLSDADGRMGVIYRELRFFATVQAAGEIKHDQIIWIRARDRALESNCAIGNQIDLSCAMALWEQRIAQLQDRLQIVKGGR